MQMDRRQFLTTTIAGASGMLLARTGLGADVPSRAAGPYDLVPLGKTGLKVSRIGIGTGMRGGNRQSNQTRMGKEKFEGLLRYAWDKGIRFFDCADMYGTHSFVASALADKPREQYTLCTKIWFMKGALPEPERPDANIVIDRFRKELKTDYIDMVLIHCMTDPKWTDNMRKQMDIMEECKQKGIIKAHAVSIHSLPALEACATEPWVDSVHTRINPYGDSMDGKPEVVVPVLKRIHDAGKGLVGMKIVGEGRYRNDEQKKAQSVKYVMGLGTVDMMIVGFEKPEEIDNFETHVKAALSQQVPA